MKAKSTDVRRKPAEQPRRLARTILTNAPLYASVAKALTERIVSGAYPGGELIPTEMELCDEMRVSRHTVREAIRRLADAGLVTRHPGIGTRAHAHDSGARYSYPAGSLSDIVEHAREIPLKVQRVSVIEARGALATLLTCRQGSRWLHVRGLRYHVGESSPLAISELYIRDKYPGLEKRLYALAGPVYVVLETYYGEVIEEVKQEILSVAAGEDAASSLQIEMGSAALEIRRRFLGNASRLLIYGRAVYPAHRFSYTAHFRREAAAPLQRRPR